MSSKKICENAIFLSFKDFEETLKKWSHEHGVLYVRKSAHSIQSANEKAPPHLKPFEDKLKYKDAQYECKFGRPRKSESAGIRQKIR